MEELQRSPEELLMSWHQIGVTYQASSWLIEGIASIFLYITVVFCKFRLLHGVPLNEILKNNKVKMNGGCWDVLAERRYS